MFKIFVILQTIDFHFWKYTFLVSNDTSTKVKASIQIWIAKKKKSDRSKWKINARFLDHERILRIRTWVIEDRLNRCYLFKRTTVLYSLRYFQVDSLDTDSQFWRWNSVRSVLYSLRTHVGMSCTANDHIPLALFSMERTNPLLLYSLSITKVYFSNILRADFTVSTFHVPFIS